MKTFDVFNGDADGICSLIQYRHAFPKESVLVTGVKRDIQLLDRVKTEQGDQVIVFDISMEKNSTSLQRILSEGSSVFYVDHHISGEIPEHQNLTAIIDTAADTCTSLLVDKHLEGKYREWAVVAAFGDNITQSAKQAVKTLGLSSNKVERLRKLGVCINYNGYGSSLDDLHFKPDTLYKEMSTYQSPFDFINDSGSAYKELDDGYETDIANTLSLDPEISNQHIALYRLPDEVWARRVSGVFGNMLANQFPKRAHAILSQNPKGGFTVSVRAPLENLDHAGELCKQFPTGGGRKGAAGINQLHETELERFVSLLDKTYRQ